MTRPNFEAFPKIPRLRRAIIVTEKIDGTNAQVHVTDDGEVYAGSRTRWITPDADNFGFARWVKDHEDELRTGLGFGTHFGEWWGAGVGRRYGLTEKRFSLFNTDRWKTVDCPDGQTRNTYPSCCSVVPTLYHGEYSDISIKECLETLRKEGSRAAPGFMQPEGVVVFMCSSQSMHKVLLENDELPKGLVTHGEQQAKVNGVFK